MIVKVLHLSGAVDEIGRPHNDGDALKLVRMALARPSVIKVFVLNDRGEVIRSGSNELDFEDGI